MAQLSVAGIYEDGKIELQEKPSGVRKAHVVVTFLPQEIDDDRREVLRQRFLDRLARGVDFGADPLPRREELYADRLRQF